MRYIVAVLLAAGICLLVPLQAQHVEVRQGDLYYIGAKGHKVRITSGGMDRDASLSADGKSIIFVRDTGRLSKECFQDPTPANTQIWLAKAAGSSWDLRLLLAPPIMLGGACYATFERPKLAPGNVVLYFTIDDSGVEGDLVAFNLKTKQAKDLTRASSFDVVEKGVYRGDLIVLQRTIIAEAMTQVYRLVDPDGKRLGYVGSSHADVERFLSDRHPVLKDAPPVERAGSP